MYQVELTPEAKSDIRRLDTSVQVRVLDKLKWLGTNADMVRHQSLQGDAWAGIYKYRLGDYRIIYQVEHELRTVRVLKVGHRRDVYK